MRIKSLHYAWPAEMRKKLELLTVEEFRTLAAAQESEIAEQASAIADLHKEIAEARTQARINLAEMRAYMRDREERFERRFAIFDKHFPGVPTEAVLETSAAPDASVTSSKSDDKLEEYHSALKTFGNSAGGPEACVNLCSLLKSTGNFFAARLCVEQAFLLLPTIPIGDWLLIDGSKATPYAGGSERLDANGEDSACILSSLEANFDDFQRQRTAAILFLDLGRRDLARTILEMSFVRAGLSQSQLELQRRIAAQTGLWDLEGPLRATVRSAGAPVGVAYVLMDANAPPDPKPLAFVNLAEAHSIDDHRGIVGRLYDLMLSSHGGRGASDEELVDELRAIAALEPRIIIGEPATDPDIYAQRFILNNLIDFARAILPFLPVDKARSNVLRDRLRAGAAPVADNVIHRKLRSEIRALHGKYPKEALRLFSLLLKSGGRGVAREVFPAIRQQIEHIEDGQVLRDFAQELRAFNLFDETSFVFACVQKVAPTPEALVTYGIIEKILGRFENAYKLFKQCHLLDLNDEFVKSEMLECIAEVFDPDALDAELQSLPLLKKKAQKDSRLFPGRSADAALYQEAAETYDLKTLAPELASDLGKLETSWSDQERIDLWLSTADHRYVNGNFVQVLRGVSAIRVVCVSPTPVTLLRIRLNGRTVRTASCEPIAIGKRYKHVYNIWFDFGPISRGIHNVEAFLEDIDGLYARRNAIIVVDEPLAASEGLMWDSVVTLPPASKGSIEDRVSQLPSSVRDAGRVFFDPVPRRIAVFRMDQLGDLVASAAAIRRLKAIFPDADMVGVVSSANEALARGFGLFSDVYSAPFVYSHTTRRRHMKLSDQAGLARKLRALKCDLAIDLSPASDTRPLLRLANARYTIGFKPHDFPWLSFGVDVVTRNPFNARERASHATIILGLVDAVSSLAGREPLILTRDDLDINCLSRFGISRPFAVLHSGARLTMKRWPFESFLALARLFVNETDLDLILLSDEADDMAKFQREALPAERVHFVQGNVAFDEFEVMMHYCAVFVGNDTGPKHLAALRGAPVVSVHMGQLNWDEWGQEGYGKIVSRRIPCCGCGIEDEEDCGKGLPCLLDIKPAEVFGAVVPLIDKSRYDIVRPTG